MYNNSFLFLIFVSVYAADTLVGKVWNVTGRQKTSASGSSNSRTGGTQFLSNDEPAAEHTTIERVTSRRNSTDDFSDTAGSELNEIARQALNENGETFLLGSFSVSESLLCIAFSKIHNKDDDGGLRRTSNKQPSESAMSTSVSTELMKFMEAKFRDMENGLQLKYGAGNQHQRSDGRMVHQGKVNSKRPSLLDSEESYVESSSVELGAGSPAQQTVPGRQHVMAYPALNSPASSSRSDG